MTPLIGITADWLTEGGQEKLVLGREYFRWIEEGGMAGCAIPGSPGHEKVALENLHGLILSGGGDIPPALYGGDPTPLPEEKYSHPHRGAFEFALVWKALKIGMPLLGICLGAQTMNASCGGTVIRHLDDPHFWHRRRDPSKPNPIHRLRVVSGTILGNLGCTRDTRVVSSHHQAVGAVAPGWTVTAHGPGGVVEAIENQRYPSALGVQWHPERSPRSPLSDSLAAWLKSRAEAYAWSTRHK